MTKIKGSAPMAAIVAALLAVGCGGGGLEKEELAKKADAICAKYSKEGKALGQPDFNDPAKAEAYFGDASDLAAEQQKDLEALEPADAVKSDYDRLTKTAAEATDLLGDLAVAAKAEDQEELVKLVQRLEPLSADVSEAATAIGASNCAG